MDVKEVWAKNDYYDMAEPYMDAQWDEIIWPKIKDLDFSNVVDLAAGHGRNSMKLAPISKKLTIVDICPENIEFCSNRFKDLNNINFAVCDGKTIPVKSKSVSLVYCFDAMVHFDSDTVESYIKEMSRVLKKGGNAFLHYSNWSGFCNDDWRYNPHARHYMTQDFFKALCQKYGLTILSTEFLTWGEDPDYRFEDLDAVSVLVK